MNGPPRNSRPAGNRAADVEAAGNDTTIVQASGLPTLSKGEAARLTEQIRLLASATWEQLSKLKSLVDQAQTGSAHVALGYASWPAYLADILGDLHLHLDREDRRDLVGYLSDKGMSTRAIAPVLGVSHMTVARDLEPPVTDVTPDGRITIAVSDNAVTITACDAGDADAMKELLPGAMDVASAIDEARRQAEEDTELEARRAEQRVRYAVRQHKTTGLDGKTYGRSNRDLPRRTPLPRSYQLALHELDRAVRRLARLHADDRFAEHRKSLHDNWWRLLCEIQENVFELDSDLQRDGRDCSDDCSDLTATVRKRLGLPVIEPSDQNEAV